MNKIPLGFCNFDGAVLRMHEQLIIKPLSLKQTLILIKGILKALEWSEVCLLTLEISMVHLEKLTIRFESVAEAFNPSECCYENSRLNILS